MQIIYHLGAHFTDEDQILACLMRNGELLNRHAIVAPPPERYRNLLRETAIELKGDAATVENQAILLDQIMDKDTAERLILSWDSFLALPTWALRDKLYPQAGERSRALLQIFPDIPAELFLALRNPASFLPALFENSPQEDYQVFLGNTDPLKLLWSEVVEQILAANPGIPLTVWCDEDRPLIWPEVLRAVSGLPQDYDIEGEDDFLASLMPQEGMTRMIAYMTSHPPQNAMQRRKIVSAFLDKFAKPDQIEMELTIPGWSEDYIAQLTANYEQDAAHIAKMPGVTFIAA